MGPPTEIMLTSGVTLYVDLVNATTGDAEPNVAHGSVTASSVSRRGAAVPATVAALSAPDAAYDGNRTTIGWVQVDATRCPGLYRCDLPSAFFDEPDQNILADENIANSGNEYHTCVLTLKATGCKTQHLPFQYVANAKNRPIVMDTLGYGLTDLTNFGPSTLAVALRNFLMGYQNYTGSTTAAVPSGTVGPRLSSAGLDGVMLEALTGAIQAINARQGLQWILAATAGGREGAGTGTTTVTSPGGTERAEYDTPGDGNRAVNSTSLTA